MSGAFLQVTLNLLENALGLEENMLGRMLVAVGVAGTVLLVCAGPTMAKKKPKAAEKATHIIAQPQCTGMKTMHWDDATQTCQKNK
jgi:hypothetical protein